MERCFIESLLYYCIESGVLCLVDSEFHEQEIDWTISITCIWFRIHSSDQSHILIKTLVWMSDRLVLSLNLLRVTALLGAFVGCVQAFWKNNILVQNCGLVFFNLKKFKSLYCWLVKHTHTWPSLAALGRFMSAERPLTSWSSHLWKLRSKFSSRRYLY